MLLFRRRPRDKEAPAEEAPAGPAPEAPPAAPATPGTTAKPAGAEPAGAPRPGAPPPLPRRVPGAAADVESGERSARCFVCGSPLNAGACPVCRITWVE